MRKWFLVLVVLLLLAGLVLATAACAKGIEAGAPYGLDDCRAGLRGDKEMTIIEGGSAPGFLSPSLATC